jgi:cholera toxin transcriptional activator
VPSDTNARVIRFGVYEADLHSGELRKHGIRLRLQDQPFQVLCMLLERPGELVTREELRQRLWPADTFVDFDHGLNTAVNKLRDVLGDSAANPRYIETLARRGYRFVGPAPVVVEESSAVGRRSSASAEATFEREPGLPTDQVLHPPASADVALNEERRSAAIPGEAPGTTSANHEVLPTAPRAAVRTLFALAQVMY